VHAWNFISCTSKPLLNYFCNLHVGMYEVKSNNYNKIIKLMKTCVAKLKVLTVTILYIKQ